MFCVANSDSNIKKGKQLGGVKDLDQASETKLTHGSSYFLIGSDSVNY